MGHAYRNAAFGADFKGEPQAENIVMGSWGHEAFENDSALDRADRLTMVDDLSLVIATFETATSTSGYLEVDEASAVIAAAEVVAVFKGAPKTPLPERALAWAAEHPIAVDTSTVQLARQAVSRVLEGSDLRELWDDSADAASWQSYVAGLLTRFQ